MTELKTFNELIRSRAEELGLSRDKLAAKMGVTAPTVYNNTCLTKPSVPRGVTLKKYAKALELNIEELKFSVAVYHNGKDYYKQKPDFNGLYLHEIIDQLKKYYCATCKDIALMCRVSHDSIYRIWSQNTTRPKRNTVKRIREAFGLQDTHILQWSV